MFRVAKFPNEMAKIVEFRIHIWTWMAENYSGLMDKRKNGKLYVINSLNTHTMSLFLSY